MSHMGFSLAVSSAAAAYVAFVAVGLMAMRGEVAVDPLWPTLGSVAVIMAVMAYNCRGLYRMMASRPGAA